MKKTILMLLLAAFYLMPGSTTIARADCGLYGCIQAPDPAPSTTVTCRMVWTPGGLYQQVCQ